MKSDAIVTNGITNPAKVAAKDSTAEAVAGAAGGGFVKCLPPTPTATTKVINGGIHARRSYLRGQFNKCVGMKH